LSPTGPGTHADAVALPGNRHLQNIQQNTAATASVISPTRPKLAIGVRGEPGDRLHWRRLAPLLRYRGVALPPRHIVCPDVDAPLEGQRLAALLASYDLPVEEQQRWRV